MLSRRKEEEVARKVREIVDREPLPDFILRYDVVPGDIDGDPAVWIKFTVAPEPRVINEEIHRRIALMDALEARVRPAVWDAFDDVMPYFRYQLIPEGAGAT